MVMHAKNVAVVALALISIMALSLHITSYNCKGLGSGRIPYINMLLKNHDIVLIQEHWLFDGEFQAFKNKLGNVGMHAVSGMDPTMPLRGRPYGGCAIIWRNSMQCQITHLRSLGRRACGIILEINETKVLLFCVYMPTDTDHDRVNLAEYAEVLETISSCICEYNVDHVIVGGDLNTDVCRTRSLHTHCLNEFITNECMQLSTSHQSCTVDYTYESVVNGVQSVIDNFLLTDNLYDGLVSVKAIHDIENLSDHSPLRIRLNIPILLTEDKSESSTHSIPIWNDATAESIANYKYMVDSTIGNTEVYDEVISCTVNECTEHRQVIDAFCERIIHCCVHASQLTIPYSRSYTLKAKHKAKFGWKELVNEHYERAMLWHHIWKCCGSPKDGVVAHIRRRTRLKYHYAVRHSKNEEVTNNANRMAASFVKSDKKNFWNNVRKAKAANSRMPSSVDGSKSDTDISNLFADKFSDLYNCVSYDQSAMDALIDHIDDNIKCIHSNDCCVNCHTVRMCHVKSAVKKLKQGKHEGLKTFYSDHLIHGTDKLFSMIASLFTCMLNHSYCPALLSSCTIIPIPKNCRQSLSDSNNYRGIALGNSIGKLLDLVIMEMNHDALSTSDMQFGFKPKLSTSKCSFVALEVIQQYVNKGSHVHCVMLDASKAFDKINHVTLFKILLEKGLCPVVSKLLLNQYANQRIVTKWGQSTSYTFKATNGIKQGGVLSPILFNVYMDVLLKKLKLLRLVVI